MDQWLFHGSHRSCHLPQVKCRNRRNKASAFSFRTIMCKLVEWHSFCCLKINLLKSLGCFGEENRLLFNKKFHRIHQKLQLNLINAVLFDFLSIKVSWKIKCITVSSKISLLSTLIIIINVSWSSDHHIRVHIISEGSCSNDDKFSFDHRNESCFNIYSYRKLMIYIGIIFQNFYCSFDQINAALVSRRDSFWNRAWTCEW